MVTARGDGIDQRAEGAARPVREAGRRDRGALRRGARGARAAGAGDADAAQDRARGAHEAGRAGHAAEARSREPRNRSTRPPRPRSRPPKPSASAASSARPGRASSMTCRSKSGRRRSRWPARKSRRSSSLDPILAVVEVAERKLHGIKLGDPAEIRLVTGHDGEGQDPLHLQDRERRRRAPIGSTSRSRMPTAAIPDGITAEVDDPARAGAGRARAALGADVLVGRRARRAHRRCGQQGGVRAGVGDRRPAAVHVGRRRRRRRARDRAGAGLRARRPGGRGGRTPRRRRPPRAETRLPPWAIPSTTPSITRG